VLFFFCAAALLTSCGDGSSGNSQATNSTSSSSTPLSAPADYLGAMGKAQKSAVKTVDVASVNQAIQMFHVENDRYPNTLQELVDEKFLPRLPDPPSGMNYSYDPKTGTVRVVNQ
jgi:hypothetical protein